ncbi:MAG: DUF4954 family protein [Spirochaetia bacterium]|nr:DUF4954 family protein [Spirochaetia bacterium]
MSEDVIVKSERALGYGFVDPKYLHGGADEYAFRDLQVGKPASSWRGLRAEELEALVKNRNSCTDWSRILVRDPFDPALIKSSEFAGLVRIGKLERLVLEHHDLRLPVGITDSRIVSCDIGDNCAVHDCSYVSHYVIGDGCILFANREIAATDHAKFGNGIVKEGEDESLRVTLDLMNEAGGRSVYPFDGMTCGDAWLWAKKRDDRALMDRFAAMTQGAFDARRGRYGEIGAGTVVKHCGIVKDVKVGRCAYLKGANKLKNLTVNSSEKDRTQIGEGVELVNGIVGHGCRVFYGCKAVRFVMGDGSSLKYGARLIHSVLGDNSTVSCCEILNNLIFPAHEQHHNTSFLIAALVKGQSNMAAGATIGSNHNSRANDGEIEAGRGFWPGLSTSVKHSSRFASYVLLAKGHYRFELDVPFPFSLVSDDAARDRLEIVPAYWWTSNLYALMRNEAKFLARDRRSVKRQRVEFSPFAPDTAEECFAAMALLEEAVARARLAADGEDPDGRGPEELRALGRALLADPVDRTGDLEVGADFVENSRRKVILRKPRRAWRAYRRIVAWYAGLALADYFETHDGWSASDAVDALGSDGRERRWENLGGQLVPGPKLDALIEEVKSGALADWNAVHAAYEALWVEYPIDKARHALHAWRDLEGLEDVRDRDLARLFARLSESSLFVEEEVLKTRKKDYDNRFRKVTFASDAEAKAVIGSAETNSFVRKTREDMAALRSRCARLADRFGGPGD